MSKTVLDKTLLDIKIATNIYQVSNEYSNIHDSFIADWEFVDSKE